MKLYEKDSQFLCGLKKSILILLQLWNLTKNSSDEWQVKQVVINDEKDTYEFIEEDELNYL